MNSNIIKFLPLALFLAFMLVVSLIHAYIGIYGQRYLFSTQAKLQMSLVPVISHMDGTIATLYITNNSYVKKGDLLFKFDATHYQQELKKAEQALSTIKKEVSKQEKAVITAERAIAQRQTELSNLSKTAFLASNNGYTASGSYAEEINIAKQQLDLAYQQLDQALQNYGKRGLATNKIKIAQAAYKRDKDNFDSAYAIAPQDGFVTHLTIEPGKKVTRKQQLFELIENDWHVYARFKPYLMKRIHPQQPAMIQFGKKPNPLLIPGIVQQVSADGVTIKILQPDPVNLLNLQTSPIVILDTQLSRNE